MCLTVRIGFRSAHSNLFRNVVLAVVLEWLENRQFVLKPRLRGSGSMVQQLSILDASGIWAAEGYARRW